MVGFEILRGRLLEHIRHRIRNGELTERALARRAGISQPHVHNLLKGIRTLTPDAGDQLMSKLGITVLDLIEADELRRALFLLTKKSQPAVEVPVLHERLGPGLPWPEQRSPFERVGVPFTSVVRITDPVVARLGEDADMSPHVGAGDLVLLNTDVRRVECYDPDTLFVVEHSGNFVLRWVRQGRGRLYLLDARSRDNPLRWRSVPDGASPVRAAAIPLRSMYAREFVYDPLLPPRGKPREPAQR